ncbi:hypothetical protein [Corynebacterium aquatimens]|uniref:hypothetical protein n=1 Tax=Corynebacterium aquatimens TaxID=1190508 RepID=UPI0025B56D5A|nr:hypothetical protein [Corynebacterium aquatimens]
MSATLGLENEGASLDYVQVPGFGRLYADETVFGGGSFAVNLVAQLGHDTGKGDQFPRYRETARVSANILDGKPLLRITQGENRTVIQGAAVDTVVVSDQGTADIEVDKQQTVDFNGNQNTVIGWGLTQNNYPGVPYSQAFVGVTAQISGSFAPFPDENASCAPMTSTSTPVTMLADGQPHPFTINLDGVRTEDFERLRVIVVDKDGNPIDGANVEKGAAIPGAGDNMTGMNTKVTLPKDDPRFHEGKGAFLQVYAVPRKGDDTRAAAGPNKRAELQGKTAYKRDEAKGKGLYDTNVQVGGLHAVNTPTFSAEHGANSGEPGKTISAKIIGAEQPDKGVKAGQEFLGENNPTFSLGGAIEYGDKNQGANDWTNPKVDPVTGEATITVGKGAKGGDLAYVPVKVTNSDGSSFTIRATFTSKQPAPVALQPAFKAGPVGDTLQATPRYTKNGEPYIDPTTVRIVGTDEKSDGKTLTVDGQGAWRVDAKTGEFFFTPVAGFVGDPTPIQYTANGVNGAEPVGPALVSVFYYPLETREATTYGPVEATQNSTDNNSPGDAGRTTAQLFPGLPSTWYGQADSPVTFQLVDPNGTPVQQGQALEILNVGTYTIDQNTGVVSFKAAENFLGANETEKDAAKVGIRTVGLTNAERGGEEAQLTAYYRPTVEKQSFALPNAREDGQTGQPQSATPNYRAFSTDPKTVKMVSVEGNTLSADGKTMVVPDQGTWTVDDNGVFTFTPVTGFVGSPAPVRYEANSLSGQKAEGTGQVAIFYPDPRTLPANTSAAQGVTQESDDTHDRNEGKATQDMFPTLPTDWYGQEDSPVKFDLVDPSGKIVETKNDKGQPTFTVENVGTYTLDPVKGLATFTPVPSFTGPAPRVEIQTKGITGGEELKAAYNPFVYPVGVEIPSAFERADQVGSPVDVTPIYERTKEDGTRDELASVNPETIQIVADGLPDGSVISEDKKSVTVPGEGSWTVDDAGKFTFTPLQPDPAKQVQGFTGNPTPVSYLAKNVQNIDALVPGQVTALYPTIATDDAITTGNKGQTQLSTDTQDGVEDKGLTIAQMFPNLNPEWAKAGMELVDLQEQGTLNDDKTVLTVEGKGTYTLDKVAGTITFAPTGDFQGTAPKVGIKLTGVDTQPVAAYTPIVRPFAKPAEDAVVVLPSKVQKGTTGEPVSLTPPLADNIDKSTIKILNGEQEVDALEVTENDKKVGTWTVDKQTGEFTFTPEEGYLGSPAPVKYTAKDRFGTKAKEPGEVAVQYPNQRTVDSATSGQLDVNQTSRTFTGEGGMFPTLPEWTSNTFALEGANDDGKIVRDGVGTFSIENGRVVFDPEPGFVGKADPVTVVATTATGETLEAKYEPVVIGVKPPTTTTPTTTTPTTSTQPTDPSSPESPAPSSPKRPVDRPFVLPSGAKMGALGKAVDVTPKYPGWVAVNSIRIKGSTGDGKTLKVDGQGTWTVDKNGTFTFSPEPGFLGTPEPISYTAKDKEGKDSDAPGWVMAYYPADADADADADANPFILPSDAVNIAKGGKKVFNLLEMNNKIDPATIAIEGAVDGKLVVPGEGTWSVNKVTGEVTFTAEKNFEGTATPVKYTARSKSGVESKYPAFLMVATDGKDPVPGPVNPTPGTTTPTGPTTTPVDPAKEQSSAKAKKTLEQCFGNAVQSPITWLLPIALVGAVVGKIAEPYMAQVSGEIAGLNAQWNEFVRKNTPDRPEWGHGDHGRRDPRNDEEYRRAMEHVNAINAQLQGFASNPDLQRIGQAIGAAVAIAAFAGLMYDWCVAEVGKAKTSVDFEKFGKKNLFATGTASPTTVPTTVIPPLGGDAPEVEGVPSSDGSSKDGSSKDGSSN